MKGSAKYVFILLVLPMLFAFFGLRFERARYAGDPDYIYLMNALNLARGHDAGHIDNPGTPVMELGAVLIHLHYFFDNSPDAILQNDVLKKPDTYVNFIRRVFILLIGLIMAWGGWIVFSRLRDIGLALLLQITPFLSVNVLEHAWTKVSPEPLLLAIGLVYALYLFRYLSRTSPKIIPLLFGFSILGGLGLATKATFLPVLVIPFFVLPGWKNKVVYFLGTIAAFFLFTSPAHNEYHRMFEWFANLITHKGIYGHGEPGLVDVPSYIRNIGTIFKINIFFSLSFLLNFIFILREVIRRNKADTRVFAILKSLFTVQVLSVLLVAKHYANHYLMPGLALNGFTWIILILHVREVASRKNYRYLTPAIPGAFALWIIIFSIPDLMGKDEGYAYTNREYDTVQNILGRDYGNYLKIYHYPDGLNALSAFKFGNGYSKLSNQEGLNDVYPQAYFFNMILNKFEFWETPVSVERLLHRYGKQWVITGRPFGKNAHHVLAGFGLRFNEVYRGMFQSVYVMDTLALSPYLKSIARGKEKIIVCGFENRSADGAQFLAGDYSLSTGYFQSSEQQHSGSFSARMDSLTEYALKLEIDSIFPGQEFSCCIWRYPANTKSFLIATLGDDPSLFYKVSESSQQTSNSGWQQLTLRFFIPDEMDSLLRLKFYIRNMAQKQIYLDDLEVTAH